MSDEIVFETPENIELSYKPAGLGTRFLAWFVDSIAMTFFCIALLIILACSGLVSDSFLRDTLGSLKDGLKEHSDKRDSHSITFILLGVWLLIWGLGSFVYYGCSELLMRGQTLGKRLVRIRVVSANGFSLDPTGVLVRNVFRVIDHIPFLWVVPVLSAQGKRFGDMVGGTLVVEEQAKESIGIREKLAQHTAMNSDFHFDAGTLKKLRPQDVDAIERLLERWRSVPDQTRHQLLMQIVPALSKRLSVEQPPTGDEHKFLCDLLASEYRRQNRQLG